jgi:hypothetical protein
MRTKTRVQCDGRALPSLYVCSATAAVDTARKKWMCHDAMMRRCSCQAALELEARTGAVRWELPVTVLASFAFAGSRLVVADSSSVRGVDPASGDVAWQHPTNGLSLVAPLDAGSVLLHLAGATCTVDVARRPWRSHAGGAASRPAAASPPGRASAP